MSSREMEEEMKKRNLESRFPFYHSLPCLDLLSSSPVDVIRALPALPTRVFPFALTAPTAGSVKFRSSLLSDDSLILQPYSFKRILFTHSEHFETEALQITILEPNVLGSEPLSQQFLFSLDLERPEPFPINPRES